SAAVAASIGGLPCPCGIEGCSAVTGRVGDCAENGNRVTAAVVGCGWSIKGPGSALFHSFVGAAASDHRSGGINDVYLLAASAAVAAGVRCLPCPRGIKR